MKKTIFLVALILIILFPFYRQIGYSIKDAGHETITIANWNLQIFGDKKAGNETLMHIYSNVLESYDIIFIQEIRDVDGDSFEKLCSLMPGYNCTNSSRAGRSSSKEQYGIIYKNNIILENLKDFNPDEKDRWERPPIKTEFNVKGYRFTAYNIHIKPESANEEIENLEDLIKSQVNNGNIIVIGDLNAACSYYTPEEKDFLEWIWVIKDSEDTTTGKTHCAYDRIILNKDMSKELAGYGINEDLPSYLSDHYPVWARVIIK